MSDKAFGTPADALANASRVKPPLQGGYTETAVVADTASAAIATGVGTTGPGHYAFACNSAHMIVFDSDSTITSPTNSEVIPAGVHHYYLTPAMTHFKITATESGYVVFWKSSFGNE